MSSPDSESRFVPLVGFSSDAGSGKGGVVCELDGVEEVSNRLGGARMGDFSLDIGR